MRDDMSKGFAREFTDLIVYRKTRKLAHRVFAISARFPREEKYSLTDQCRRASRSIGGQIAEAWAKRRYPKHFASKISDANGEQLETKHWILTAFDSRYISREEAHALGSLAQEIGHMLRDMEIKAVSFCGDDYSPVI